MIRELENITCEEAEKAKFIESSERDSSGGTGSQSINTFKVTKEMKGENYSQSQKFVGQGAMA